MSNKILSPPPHRLKIEHKLTLNIILIMLYFMIISEMEYKLLGESIQIRELNETIKQVAPTNISVLITGESGTGKEVVANAIQHYSKRKDRPLIKVNCGAIPEGIIESELFGHQKGAFTGAIESRAGYFETADKGTIFLENWRYAFINSGKNFKGSRIRGVYESRWE